MKIFCKVSFINPTKRQIPTKKSNMKITSIISGTLIATLAIAGITANVQAKTLNPAHNTVMLSDTGKMKKDKMSKDKMSHDKMASGRMSTDKMSKDKMSHDKMSKSKMGKSKMGKDSTGKM
ncbi:pentapeptide MXKDX repeat protein [Mucilaginibacter sp. OAE612]|jgi:pentapeptide MXKDX repeat protein